MKSGLYVIVLSTLTALPIMATAAGKYTWFDGDLAVSGPLLVRPSTFGVDVYRSIGEPAKDTQDKPSTEDTVSLFGDHEARVPEMIGDDDMQERRFVNFGVRWKHRLSTQDQLSVSAEQGEGVLSHPDLTFTNSDTLDTRATVSWTRELTLWGWRPNIVGGVFLGEEAMRDDTVRGMGRRYYGFTVGGEMRLMQSHTPYVSFRMERSLYDLPDAGIDSSLPSFVNAVDDFSRLAAGWRWEIQRGWSLQAEASYGFDLNRSSDPLGLERDRSRVFFGTRFDFR